MRRTALLAAPLLLTAPTPSPSIPTLTSSSTLTAGPTRLVEELMTSSPLPVLPVPVVVLPAGPAARVAESPTTTAAPAAPPTATPPSSSPSTSAPKAKPRPAPTTTAAAKPKVTRPATTVTAAAAGGRDYGNDVANTIYAYWVDHGATPDQADQAVRIARCESDWTWAGQDGGNAGAMRMNVWDAHAFGHPEVTSLEELYDPTVQLDVAFGSWVHGGKTWSGWGCRRKL